MFEVGLDRTAILRSREAADSGRRSLEITRINSARVSVVVDAAAFAPRASSGQRSGGCAR